MLRFMNSDKYVQLCNHQHTHDSKYGNITLEILLLPF